VWLHAFEALHGGLQAFVGRTFVEPPPNAGTVSNAPPRPRAITGLPLANASTGVRPKSSSPGSTNARHRAYSPRRSSSFTCLQGDVSAAAAFSPALYFFFRTRAGNNQAPPAARKRAHRGINPLVGHNPETMRK